MHQIIDHKETILTAYQYLDRLDGFAHRAPYSEQTKANLKPTKMADVMMAESSSAPLTRRQHLANTFEAYRAGLDADVRFYLSSFRKSDVQNERRERLIITSRLITQLSKKLIFHLHRGATSSPAARTKTLSQAREKEREIWANFVKIKEELRGSADEVQAFWKWNRQV
jgi:hypothetical protein